MKQAGQLVRKVGDALSGLTVGSNKLSSQSAFRTDDMLKLQKTRGSVLKVS